MPESAALPQPGITTESLLNRTIPVGLTPVTPAENNIHSLMSAGFVELRNVVVVVARPPVITCEIAALEELEFAASPEYAAMMLCVPPPSVLVAHIAVLVSPLPVRATAPQPPMAAAPSLKLTVPVGFVPRTVAVRLTDAPRVAGFGELVSVVLLALGPLFTLRRQCHRTELTPGCVEWLSSPTEAYSGAQNLVPSKLQPCAAI